MTLDNQASDHEALFAVVVAGAVQIKLKENIK